MISGFTSAQSLISNVERDSIVSKIIRGNECFDKLILSNDVIIQGEKVISAQNNVINSQNTLINTYGEQVKVFKENELNYNKLLSNEKEISKKYKRKQFGWLIKGVAIGVVGGVLIK
jgi:hypothetical protein